MKIIETSNESSNKLLAGINKVVDIVGSTIGPAGKNIVIGREYQYPLITNDGVTIADEIELEDEIENLGAQIIKEATKKTNAKVGDGTTTTTVLLGALVNAIFDKYYKGLTLDKKNPMTLRRELESALPNLISLLEEKKVEVQTQDDLYNVALVSCENSDIAKVLSEICWTVGKDGKVTVEDGFGDIVEHEVKPGAEFAFGTDSRFRDIGGDTYTLEYPSTLLLKDRFNSSMMIQSVISSLSKLSKNLVVFTESYDKSLLADLFAFNLTYGFRVFVVPVLGSRKDYWDDIKALVGGEVIEEGTDFTLKNFKTEWGGKCKKIVLTKDTTTFISETNLIPYIDSLKEQKDKSISAFDKEQIEKRIAKLVNGVGIIKVGAPSKTEQEYLKHKIEDAVNATMSAFRGGIVKGGGIALKEVSEQITDPLLKQVLNAPYDKIQSNAGEALEINDSIVDPFLVTKACLETAVSVAGLIITTYASIGIKTEDKKNPTL